VHRVCSSKQYRCQPWEILQLWTWAEVWEACRVLDYIEALQAEKDHTKPHVSKSNLPRRKKPKPASPA
jgi:hypothetical protein